MAEQWEFCVLGIDNLKSERNGLRCDLYIVYMGHPYPIRQLSNLERDGRLWRTNPINDAMGILGAYGWELVTVQHGSPPTHQGFGGGVISWTNMVAYFKRPVIAGRPIDDVRLEQALALVQR